MAGVQGHRNENSQLHFFIQAMRVKKIKLDTWGNQCGNLELRGKKEYKEMSFDSSFQILIYKNQMNFFSHIEIHLELR